MAPSTEVPWLPLLGTTAAVAAGVAAIALLKQRGSAEQPPGPVFFIPLLGKTPEFINNPMLYMWKRYKRYNSLIFRSHVLGHPLYVVGDSQMLRGGLSDLTVTEAAMPFRTFTQLMGDTYYRLGAHHKVFRKHFMAAVMPANIKAHLQLFSDCVQKHTRAWLEASQNPAGPGHVMIDHEVRVVLMALSVGPVSGFQTLESGKEAELLDMACTVQAGLFCMPLYLPGTQWWKAWNTKDKYFEALASMLRDRFPPATPGGPLRLEADKGAVASLDLIAAVLKECTEAGVPLDPIHMAMRAAVNILGSTETTASEALAMLVITAARPDVQQKLRDEQASLVRTSGPTISWDDLSSGMPYCDATVREVLRLFPAAHGSFRRLKVSQEVGGYQLKAGSMLLVTNDLLTVVDGQHSGGSDPSDRSLPPAVDPAAWERSFEPERWLDSGYSHQLHVFGYGPQVCAGRDIALLELKLILAHMSRQCTWSLPNCPKPQLGFIPWIHLLNGKAQLKLTAAPVA